MVAAWLDALQWMGQTKRAGSNPDDIPVVPLHTFLSSLQRHVLLLRNAPAATPTASVPPYSDIGEGPCFLSSCAESFISTDEKDTLFFVPHVSTHASASCSNASLGQSSTPGPSISAQA